MLYALFTLRSAASLMGFLLDIKSQSAITGADAGRPGPAAGLGNGHSLTNVQLYRPRASYVMFPASGTFLNSPFIQASRFLLHKMPPPACSPASQSTSPGPPTQ